MDNSRSKLKGDVRWSMVSTLADTLLGAGVLVFVGNFWGSAGLGEFSLAFSVYMTLTVLSNLGIQASVLYEIVASGRDTRRISRYAYSGLAVSLALGILAGAVMAAAAPLLARLFDEPEVAALLRAFAWAAPVFIVNKTLMGILNAFRRMRILTAVSLVRSSVVLAYSAWAGLASLDLDRLPWGFLAAECCSILLLAGSCYGPVVPTLPGTVEIRRLVGFGWKACLSGFVSDFNSRLDIFAVGFFCDAARVGVYSVASMAARALWILPGAVQRVTAPLVTELYNAGETEKLRRTMDVLMRLGTAGFFILGLFSAFLYPAIVGLVYPGNAEWIESWDAFCFLLPGTLLFTGVAMLGGAVSINIGRPENALKTTLLTLSINAALNAALVPALQESGAALATSLSLVAAFGYYTVLSRRHLGYEIPFFRLMALFALFSVLLVSHRLLGGMHIALRILAETAVLAAGLGVLNLFRSGDLELVRFALRR